MPNDIVEDIDTDTETDTNLAGLDHLDQESGGTKVKEGVASAPKNEEWKDAIKELTKTVSTAVAPKEAPPAPLTQDQIDEYYATFKPEKTDPDFFRKFLRLQTDLDPVEIEKTVKEFKPIFEAMHKGISKEAVVGAYRLFQKELKQLKDELAPDREFISEARAERLKTKFMKAAPFLADEDGGLKYPKTVKYCAGELSTQNFENETEYFKTLADNVVAMLKEQGVSIASDAVQTKTKPTGTPRLPRTSVGGTGGAGGGGGTPIIKGDATQEFLDD